MISGTCSDQRAEFSRFVDGEVVSAIRAGAIGFVEILRRLPSVYPTELLASVDRLAARGVISSQLTQIIRYGAGRQQIEPPGGRSLLPLPHPLNFEWRFTPETSRGLLNLVTKLTPPCGEVLLFGTPGLAYEALTLPVSRRISFLGEDNVVTQRLGLLNRAVGSPLSIACQSDEISQASADAVILDPPWYKDFIRPMLETAGFVCRPGGIVLISLPPPGTRPGAEMECSEAVQYAVGKGFDLLDCQLPTIGYDTPFFETNALTAIGVNAPSCWRRGDLVALRKTRRALFHSLPASCRPRGWVEVSIGRMRLFIRARTGPVTGSQGLIRLLDGDILPSVSRRDARRIGAQVWTSGNRIFGTDNPALVLEAALSHTDPTMRREVQLPLLGNLYERGALERVGQQLLALAELEATEEQGSGATGVERKGQWTSPLTKSWSTSAATISG